MFGRQKKTLDQLQAEVADMESYSVCLEHTLNQFVDGLDHLQSSEKVEPIMVCVIQLLSCWQQLNRALAQTRKELSCLQK